MTNKHSLRTRRQRALLDQLRAEVVGLAPGTLLPPRHQLASQFACGTLTIQHALNQLAHEGFVRNVPRRGTFVVEHPPHLSHFALAYPRPPSYGHVWPGRGLYNSLALAADELNRTTNRHVQLYTGYNEETRHDDWQRLREDANASRLAGVVLVHPWNDGYVVDLPIPVIRFSSAPPRPNFLTMELSNDGLLDEALKLAAARGGKRVAMICPSQSDPVVQAQRLMSRVQPLGLQSRSAWVLGIDIEQRGWATNATECLFASTVPDERPDVLIIPDGILASDVAQGLVATKLRVPEDICVIAHANFPMLEHDVLPFVRVGWNICNALSDSLDALARKQAGHSISNLRTPIVIREPR